GQLVTAGTGTVVRLERREGVEDVADREAADNVGRAFAVAVLADVGGANQLTGAELAVLLAGDAHVVELPLARADVGLEHRRRRAVHVTILPAQQTLGSSTTHE